MKKFRMLLFPVWIALLGIISACNRSSQPEIKVLHIEGVDWACNLTASYSGFGPGTLNSEENELVLAAVDGDLLYMLSEELDFYYRYNSVDGHQLMVSMDTLSSLSVCLNGSLESLGLDDKSSPEMLNNLSETEMEQLGTLHITGALSEEMLSALQQHEASLRGTGIVMESDATNLQDLLPVCQPKMLIINDSWSLPDVESSNELAGLEFLWVSGDMEGFSKVSACCSNLESLIISDWNPAPGELLPLSGLQSLKNLTVAESGLVSLGEIELPESLRSISLFDCDTLNDLGTISEFSDLYRLGLSESHQITGLSEILEMPDLRWLSLPGNISQQEFRDLTARLSQLEVLELVGCTQIQDLSPLIPLTYLRSLSLDLEKSQLGKLDSLTQLEIIILSDEVIDDNPEWYSKLKVSLPGSTIVPGSGLCLGSGWLLLLLPFILLFRFTFKPKA